MGSQLVAAEQQTRAVFVLQCFLLPELWAVFYYRWPVVKMHLWSFSPTLHRALCSFPPDTLLIFALRKDQDVNVFHVWMNQVGQHTTFSSVFSSEISSDLVEYRFWSQVYKLLAIYKLVAKYFFLTHNGNNKKENYSVVVLDTLSLW